MKVGFIGLGIMGSRMAANLQRKGYSLVVHNRTRERAQALLAGGADWAETPAGVGRQADVLFTMLSTPEVVEATALGESGFLGNMRPGTLWVDSTTVNPSFSRRMAKTAAEFGVHFLDAPVAGSKAPAEKAQLLFLVGGQARDFETARPLFEAMGRMAVHVGDHGLGSAMKMVNNLLLAGEMAAFAEALTLGEALGLSREKMLDTLANGVVLAPILAGKRALIESDRYEAEFPLQWMHKDAHLAALSGYETGTPMPVTNAAKELYAMAAAQGLGEEDFSAVYAFLSGLRQKGKDHP